MRPLKIDGMIPQTFRPTGLHGNIDNGGRAERSVFRYFLALPTYSFFSGDSKSSCDKDALQSLIGELSGNAASYPFEGADDADCKLCYLFANEDHGS